MAVDNNGIIYAALASMLLRQKGKANLAKKVCEDGAARFPQYGRLWQLKAIANYLIGERSNALNDAKRATELIRDARTRKLYEDIRNNLPI